MNQQFKLDGVVYEDTGEEEGEFRKCIKVKDGKVIWIHKVNIEILSKPQAKEKRA